MLLIASIAAVVVLGYWFAHRRALPFAYDYQNAMGLLSSTVLLLALACAYSAAHDASAGLRSALEILMCKADKVMVPQMLA